jgi:predicted CxxxxCH...CXXCH cytochrome family protein
MAKLGKITGLVLAVFILTSPYAFALDAPHTNTPGYGIECGNCHWTHSSSTAPWENTEVPEAPDNTINNRRCYTCHDGSKPEIPGAKTHSSSATSSMYWTTVGGWKTECVTCHDPHQQRQTRAWGAPSYVVTGAPPVTIGSWVTGSNRTQITVAAGLTENYFGYYFMPDKNYPFYYRIETDTTNSSTFEVKGQVLTAYVKTGGSAIVYAKNVKESINYMNPGGAAVGGSVKLYRSSGANGPGDSGNASSSVCYVCHTQTTHWSAASGDIGHEDGGICAKCHDHVMGFKPSCKICHAYPPISDEAASPNGLVWVTGSQTGSATAGAHNTHVNAKAIDCEACHYNSVGRNPSHDNHQITIGFNNLGGATQGGAYDGQTSANYDVTATSPATAVSKSGSKTCSNVYCHGNYSGSGKNASPVWDQPASGACGTCHGASNTEYPQSGSHQRHVGNTNYLDGIAGQQRTFNREYACTLCHKDIVTENGPDTYAVTDNNAHANGVTDWKFDATDTRVGAAAAYSIAAGTTAPSDGTSRAYGVCNNIYCHSNVQPDGGMGAPSQYTAPLWGAKLSCQGCHVPSSSSGMGHGATISTGSHTKHMSYVFNLTGEVRKCTLCHKWNAGAAFGYCDQCHTLGGSGERLYHANGSVDVLFDTYYGNGVYNGTPTPGDGYSSCSNTYCHSNGTSVSTGTIPDNTSPVWGSGSLACTACHNNPPDYANGSPKANSHPAHANAGITCDKCHNATTTDGSTIASTANHVNKAYDLQAGSGVSFTYTYSASGGSCSSISCHGNTDATWGVSDCLGCHSVSQGNRAAITPQFSANSHHIQGTVSNDKCYQCHWEANSDGTINRTNYVLGTGQLQSFISAHGSGIVNLVIYGNGARPTTYTLGTTALQYTANGSRTEIASINAHCLGCHNENNKTITPFGDSKTPAQYSWDGFSIDTKYSSPTTTPWGKYSSAGVTPKTTQTKAYSAHGNAVNNQGGWNLSETWPNTRGGAAGGLANIACFDCHNSHGSNAGDSTHPTTSYTSSTTDGGILKNTTASKGGYAMNYTPAPGGSTSEHNAYNPGSGLCFDCHMTQNSGTTPWGYGDTFGATQPIMSYWDSPYFGSGTFASQQRYPYKAGTGNKGGHFGASSSLATTPDSSHQIKGLCTPCHDPHGVSPSLGARAQYAVPLLKETFLTSPYKEDATPASNSVRSVAEVNAGNVYHIDQNTFGSDIKATVTGITQTDNEFAGLCLQCHPKNTLTNGVNGGTWKSVDRIHESVKGWGANPKHNYVCSKCHTPHNSRLPRLMATNCLNTRHKGRMANNASPILSGPDYNRFLGGCCDGGGSGNGNFPGSGNGSGSGYYGSGGYSYTVSCHENQSADQSWNNKTTWVNNPPAVPTLVDESNTTSTTVTLQYSSTDPEGDAIQYSIQIDDASDFSSPNYTSGWISGTSYTVTVGNNATWYWRVKAKDATTESGWSAADSFMVSDGVAPPQVTLASPASGTSYTNYPVGVPLQWNAAPPLAQYRLEVDNESGFSNPLVYDSGWTTITSQTVNITTAGTYYWRVQARDSVTLATGPVSAVGSFIVDKPPTVPTLIDEPNGTSTSVTLQWNASTDPEGDAIQYYVQVDDDPNFGSPNFGGTWQSGTSLSFTVGMNTTWYWRVKARDSWSFESGWSSRDSFIVSDGVAPPAPTLSNPGNGLSFYTNCDTLGYWMTFSYNSQPATEYRVLVDDDPAFGSVNYDSGWIPGTGWSADLSSNWGSVTYYWKVGARDPAAPGTENWSGSRSFVINYGGGCPKDSCPFVFAWDGEKYEYVTDIQGSAIGYPASFFMSKYVTMYEPVYVVLNGLKADGNGKYDVKLRETLSEVSYADEVKLLAVDYPAGYEVVSSTAESTYHYNYVNPFKLYTIKEPRPPVSAVDKNGSDVLASVLEIDGTPLPLELFVLESYTFDFGPLDPANAKLVIDGWTAYGASYRTTEATVQPYIEVVDGNGQWVKVRSFGVPAGDMKRMVIDISGMFLSNDHRVRIHAGLESGMVWRIDKLMIDDSPPAALTINEINADYADLHQKGRVTYQSSSSEHRIMAIDDVMEDNPDSYGYGNFTKYGDVKALLTSADDMFAIMRHGDEISLTFPVTGLPPLEPGMVRGFVLKTDVYYKNYRVDNNVEPLPFHGMSIYPYDPAVEHYPDDADHTQYRTDYNTRVFYP